MHDLNDALDDLRSVIPYAHGPSVRKLSKIATLLLAKNYIMMQTNIIDELKKELGVLLKTSSSASGGGIGGGGGGVVLGKSAQQSIQSNTNSISLTSDGLSLGLAQSTTHLTTMSNSRGGGNSTSSNSSSSLTTGSNYDGEVSLNLASPKYLQLASNRNYDLYSDLNDTTNSD